AVPALAAARLLAGPSDGPGPRQEAAEVLNEIEYADVAQAVVELPIDGLDRVLDASGILFPRTTGRLMTACTWLSTKWDHYRRPGSALIRLSSGRFGDDRPSRLTDSELVDVLLDELSTVVEFRLPPTATRVVRWPKAFPQYTPGHQSRVGRARELLAQSDRRIALVGAPYDGIGVPACIAAGRQAATNLMSR
ncbi:MAG: protoporphyrinogen oxidase, partial [Acidimicrobiales bacterium]